MSPTSQARPTRPTTTYAETADQPSAGPDAVDRANAILDEIDELLAEENEHLAHFRQLGGQ